jgi:hypothetical protein
VVLPGAVVFGGLLEAPGVLWEAPGVPCEFEEFGVVPELEPFTEEHGGRLLGLWAPVAGLVCAGLPDEVPEGVEGLVCAPLG